MKAVVEWAKSKGIGVTEEEFIQQAQPAVFMVLEDCETTYSIWAFGSHEKAEKWILGMIRERGIRFNHYDPDSWSSAEGTIRYTIYSEPIK